MTEDLYSKAVLPDPPSARRSGFFRDPPFVLRLFVSPQVRECDDVYNDDCCYNIRMILWYTPLLFYTSVSLFVPVWRNRWFFLTFSQKLFQRLGIVVQLSMIFFLAARGLAFYFVLFCNPGRRFSVFPDTSMMFSYQDRSQWFHQGRFHGRPPPSTNGCSFSAGDSGPFVHTQQSTHH